MTSRFRIPSAKLLASLALGASITGAQTLSGKVSTLDGAAKPGVTVALKSGDLILATTTTGLDGTWILEPSTSVQRETSTKQVTGNLTLDGSRRLRVGFDGRDLSGRFTGGASMSRRGGASGILARGASESGVGSPDTLVYSMDDRVFLRDTLSTVAVSGIERTFDTTWNAQRVYGYLVDARDQKTYRTITIGDQVWMAQNLAYVRDTSWIQKDSASLGLHYGRLYQWAAAMDTSATFLKDIAEITLPWRGICPEGWHLPSEPEWSTLVNHADSATSGAALKASEFASDTSKALVPTDAWGFRVLPGGQVMYNTYASRNVYYGFPTTAIFWTASEYSTTKSWSRTFTNATNSAVRKLTLKTEGYSVRCLKD